MITGRDTGSTYLFDHVIQSLVAVLKPRLPQIWLFLHFLHLVRHLEGGRYFEPVHVSRNSRHGHLKVRCRSPVCKRTLTYLGSQTSNGRIFFQKYSKDTLRSLILIHLWRQRHTHTIMQHLHYPSPSWSGRRFRCFWTKFPETRQTSERRGSAVDRQRDESLLIFIRLFLHVHRTHFLKMKAMN